NWTRRFRGRDSIPPTPSGSQHAFREAAQNEYREHRDEHVLGWTIPLADVDHDRHWLGVALEGRWTSGCSLVWPHVFGQPVPGLGNVQFRRGHHRPPHSEHPPRRRALWAISIRLRLPRLGCAHDRRRMDGNTVSGTKQDVTK